MAGIFVNVNDDIQNLRALKNEIENVKRALKGINVKVDFDIKEGLEKQLKSLTVEYDALASKIAETEGKIKVSIDRINESTQKILQAQEKIIGAAQGQSVTQQNVAATNAETSSVQAQSKAYDELKADIDSVLGSRAENIKRMVDEQNAIRLINAELKQMEKSTGGGNYSPAQLKRVQQLNDALLTHKAALSEVRIALNNNAKMDNAAADSMKKLSLQLGQMRMAYRELTEEERKSPFGEELFKSINEIDAKLKEFDASIGNYQRNVGNYGSGFNGLNNSVQQIVRELPSAAMGLNTFFLAISNNLPILVDEINRAKKANEMLKQSGQTSIPVWKQVATSLFSWQTALMMGISLLSMYGKDIVNWIKNLFSASDAQDEVNKKMQEELELRQKAAQSINSQMVAYRTLKSQWEALKNSMSDQNAFIKKNEDEFKKLGIAIKDISDAENVFVSNSDAFINAMMRRARAAAAAAQMEKEYETIINNEIAKDAFIKQGGDAGTEQAARKKAADYIKKKIQEVGLVNDISNAQYFIEELENAQKENRANKNKGIQKFGLQEEYNKAFAHFKKQLAEADAYVMFTQNEEVLKAESNLKALAKIAKDETKAAEDTLKTANIDEYENENNKKIKKAKDVSDELLDIELKNEQDRINLMKDGSEKRQQQIELNFKKEKAAIEKTRKKWENEQGGKLTDQQSHALMVWGVNAENKYNQDKQDSEFSKLLEKYKGYYQKRKEIQEKFEKERTELEKKGASKEVLDEQKYQENEALKALDLQFAQREESFNIWAERITNKTIEKLKKLLNQAENELSVMEREDPNNKGIAVQRAKVVKLEDTISQKKANVNPDAKASEKWKDLYNTLRKVEDQFSEIGEAVGGTVGEIISAAGGITSSTITMVEGIVRLTDGSINAIQGTSEAATTALQTVEKASVILAIIGAALQIATKISQMFGADYSNYNKAKENYESYVDVLDKVIDKQKELAETMTGQEAVKASEKAVEMINKQIEAARELGKMRLNAGASAGSHSIGVRTKKNMTDKGWSEALSAIGYAQYNKIKEGRMEGLFNLSVQQLEKLQMEAPTFWAQLDNDVRGYLEQIIESNEGIEQMKETLNEALTGMTFEDFSSDILESLYDVEKGAEGIFDDMSDYMRKAMIKAMYVKNYEPEMQKWYDQWAKAMEDGVMTTEEKSGLDSLKESIINGAMAAAENINSMFDVSDKYNQEASAKGFETMTQDQARSLDGRFTALQLSGEESNEKLTLMNATMNDLKTVGLNIQDVASSIQDLLANSYIELVTISENTGETVKCLKVIQSDIAQVKENTKNL